MVIAARLIGFAANVPVFLWSLLVGLIGLVQGTDTSVRENQILALVGLSFAGLAAVTCLALFISVGNKAFWFMFLVSCLGYGVLLVFAAWRILVISEHGSSGFFHDPRSLLLCLLASCVSIVAVVVRTAFQMKLDGRLIT